MAAPGAGAGSRRASASRPRRASAAAESNENDDLTAAPSPSSSAFAHPAASVPHFSLPPRSPLAAIADPGRNPRSAPVTPKSLAGTPRARPAGTGTRDRTSSTGAARRVFDLRDLGAAEVLFTSDDALNSTDTARTLVNRFADSATFEWERAFEAAMVKMGNNKVKITKADGGEIREKCWIYNAN